MPRECRCAGTCGPEPIELTRREVVGAAGIGAVMGMGAAEMDYQLPQVEVRKWMASVASAGKPRRYRSDTHTDARMHLGGIGTGNMDLGVDGQLTTWQLFNTLRDGYLPLFFGVRAGSVARLLQTRGGPQDWPRVHAIEMTGEYPLAELRYVDADLPVHVTLRAFTPFAPLDTELSSLPLACFVFRVTNPTDRPLNVSLAAFCQNGIGYDAMGVPVSFNSVGFNEVSARLEVEHPNFGGNFNEARVDGRLTSVVMGAVPAHFKAARPCRVFTNLNPGQLADPPGSVPEEVELRGLDRLETSVSQERHTVIWLEEPAANLPAQPLRLALEAVRAGANLVISGAQMPLLAAYGAITKGAALDSANLRPDIVFEDFESGYGKWSVTGTAFGANPAGGTLPNQQRVTGFLGKGLVNSFLGGDGTTGRMTSQEFTIERNFIRFLVGGGSHPTTQIRLVVDGQVVRAASGKDSERLEPMAWDVREFLGRQARLEIVDEHTGGWGHINVDQIEFADLAGSADVMKALDELLPVRFSGVRMEAGEAGKPPRAVLEEVRLKPGAARAEDGSYRMALGKGQVVVAGISLLPADRLELIGAKLAAFRMLLGYGGVAVAGGVGVPEHAPGYGAMALATMGPDARVRLAFEDWDEAWRRFARTGAVSAEAVKPGSRSRPTASGRTVNSAVSTTLRVDPGKTVEAPFLLAWHYPNKYGGGQNMGNHYARKHSDVGVALRSAARNFNELRSTTELFRKTLYNSTLPYWLLDCLSSQISTIRHIGVVFRIGNGDVYGWEGSNGCCQPTCTHVWGYEQTLAYLFPDLERDMRRIDFKHQQRADGGVNNRTEVPSPPRPTGEMPFTDGHASCILKAYREALNQPDDTWMREYWPHIRRGVEYLIGRDAATSGGQPDGTLADDQWNTYDQPLHGVTTFLSGYYLAALRAGEEWAKRVGDQAAAERFHGIFQRGSRRLVELCWNGEYFQQNLEDYLTHGGEVGPGCMSDQLIGQWWAHQLGLGYLLPEQMVKEALRSVFKYNWKTDLTGWRHAPRAFAGAKDKGLIIVTWPRGGRPGHVMLYSDEVWTGIEYQVAAHLIYEGMVQEGLAIAKAARDRYDGIPRPPIPRNPWNEIECGGHYARAMSSWSLLLALSGYRYDGPARDMRFAPRITPERFRAFFCGPEGWGSLRQVRDAGKQTNDISVAWGSLPLSVLRLQPPAGRRTVSATLRGKPVRASATTEAGELVVRFPEGVRIVAGETLRLEIG